MNARKYDLDQPPGASAPSDNAVPTTAPGASNKQLSFLRGLVRERDLTDDHRSALERRIAVQQELNDDHGDCSPPLATAGITKRLASEWIGRLLEKPKRPQELPRADIKRDIVGELHPNEPQRRDIPTAEEVPTGHYAIKNAEGQLRFYRLWRGTRNPNYVKLYVEHGPNESEVQPFQAVVAIIKQIAEDALGAARLYGRHSKSCGKCGTRLTNRVSRLLDIGPVCGGHMCDPEIWADLRRRAREALEAAGLDPDTDVEDTDDLDRIRELAGL